MAKTLPFLAAPRGEAKLYEDDGGGLGHQIGQVITDDHFFFSFFFSSFFSFFSSFSSFFSFSFFSCFSCFSCVSHMCCAVRLPACLRADRVVCSAVD